MGKQIIFIITVFFFQFFSSQRNEPKMFFGFPIENTRLISRDIIITNLPEINYNRGIFSYVNNPILQQLLNFLKTNEEKIFEITVNRCVAKGNKKYNEKVNENLTLSLQHFFEAEKIKNVIMDKSNFQTCYGNLIQNKENSQYISSGNYLSLTVH